MTSRFSLVALLALLAGWAPAPGLADPLVIESGPPAGSDLRLIGLRQFGSVDGLPQLTVLDMAMDARGYLYAGTLVGLSRYDGRQFQALTLGEPLDGQPVRWLHGDESSGLWLGSALPGVFRYENGAVRALSMVDGGPLDRPVDAMAASRWPDRVWVGTADGVLLCGRGHCQSLEGSAGLEVARLLEGQERDAGALWVGTNLDGLYRLDVDDEGRVLARSRVLGREHGLPNSAIRGLAYSPFDDPAVGDASLWLATGRGVAAWRPGHLRVYGPEQGFPPAIQTDLAAGFDLAGSGRPVLLVSTLGAGVLQFERDGGYRVFTAAQGLPDVNVGSILVTGEGRSSIQWLGTADSGALRLEPGRIQVYDERHGLPQRPWSHVGALRQGDGFESVWASSAAGSAALGRDGRWHDFLPAPYRSRVVHAVQADAWGGQWFGTERGLLWRDGQDRWREFTLDNSALPAVRVMHLLWHGDAHHGRLFVGTNHGLAQWHGGALRALDLPDEPPSGAMALGLVTARIDGVDAPVLLSRLGVHRLDRDVPQRLPLPCLAGRDAMSAFAMDRWLWLATATAVLRVDLSDAGLKCEMLAEPVGFVRGATAIAADAQGRLHLFGHDGVRRIAHPSGDLSDPDTAGWEHFGLAEGLPSLGAGRAAVLAGDGRLFAANSAGVLVFDGLPMAPSPARAPMAMRIYRDGVEQSVETLHVPAAHDELLFRFDLLSFRRESRIRYRSWLEGLESEPVAWSAENHHRYSHLPPGRYRFKVYAMDADAEVHGPSIKEVIVASPWWQHPLILAAGVLLVLLLGLAIGRWRNRAIAARAARLASLVAERTAELADANRRLVLASYTDPLTGARNRRYFYDQVADWLADSVRHGGLWLLLADIDHFKQINDRHGHAAGDAVLAEVARRLRSIDPRIELIRWGGEEFLLVRHHASDVDGPVLARAVLDAVADTPVDAGAVVLPVRCSIGFTRCRPPAEGIDAHIDLIVARADGALYEAKASGRNRAVQAPMEDGAVAASLVD